MEIRVKCLAVVLSLLSLSAFGAVTTWPTASELTYGQQLQQSLLSGGATDEAGAFAFENPSDVPNAGTADYDVVFTPDVGDPVTNGVSVVVQKKTLTVTGTVVANKEYDGNTTAGLSGYSLVGIVSGDSVTLSYFGGVFASADVGTDIAVYAYGGLTPPAGNNYQLSLPEDLSGDITAKELTVTGAGAEDKTYDGTTAAVITNATLSGAVSGDDVTLANATSGTFASADADTGITVTPAMTLSGNSAGNYTLTQPSGLSADILKADQTITDFVPADGTNLLITANVTLSATASSGLAVSYEVVSGPASILLYNLSFSGDGTVEVVAHQTGAGNYNSVSVTNTVTVSKVAQTISDFLPAASSVFSVSDGVGLSATASSGLDVSFAVESGPGSINSDTNLTFSSGGTVVVVASQSGNGTYSSAVPVTNSYTVQDSASVALSDLSYTYDGNSHSATVVTTPEGLTVDVTYDGSVTLPVAAGTYEVIGVINETFYEGAATNDLVISKATPDISGTTASPVTYGAALQEVFLNKDSGGVAGTFAFENPTDIPPYGTAGYNVIFTPTDTGNYNTVTQSVSVTVSKRALSITGAGVQAKTYDDTTAATVTNASLSGVVGDDDVFLDNTSAYFTQSAVGTDLSVVASFSLTGADAGNYTLEQLTGLTGDIVAKELTISGAGAQDKVYDGDTVAVITNASLSGVVGGDNVILVDGAAGTFAQSDIGVDIDVTTSMSLGGSDSGNYTLVGQPAGLTADITAAPQAISGFLPVDGTNMVATTTNGLSATASSGLDVSFAVIEGGAFAEITDGTNLSFTASGAVKVAATQAGGGNYAAATPVTNTYTVVKAAADVTLSDLAYTYDPDTGRVATATTDPVGLTVSLTYDGSATLPTNAGTYEVIGTISDVLYQGSATNDLVISKASADVTLDNLAYTYDGSSHAASATTDPVGLTVDLTYDGSATAPTAAGTYEVIGVINDANYEGSATNDLEISQATPVLSNLSATELTYGQQLQQSVLSGDSTVGGTFAFTLPTSVPDAGTADYDVVFTPSDTANYSSESGSVSVTVDQRLLTTTGVTVDNKVYDGTTSATLSGGSLNNTVGGDDVSLSNPAGTFSQADVGSGLTVTPALTLSGDDAANYVLQQPTGLSANITAKELTVSGATAEDKAYDGTDVATISGASLSGVVGGDSVTLVDGTTGTFSQSDIGTDIAVTTAMSIGGTDASNYTLAGQPSGLTADITAASQTISNFLPADGTNLVATTTNVLSATASSGSNVTFAVVAGSATITDGTNLSFSASGTVEVEASQVGGGNYAAAIPVTNTYTVVKADADVTLSDLTYTYDPDTGRAATATTDPVGLTVTLTYDGGATLPTNAGTYEVIGIISDVLYQGSATNDLVISKASASVTLDDLTPTYDGSSHAATATTDPVGLTVDLTYDGSGTAPTAAGTYEVIGVVNDANYEGSATNDLVISKASAVVTLDNLSYTYDGSSHAATATTDPVGLTVDLTYDGSATAPTAAGTYEVIGVVSEASYQGAATNELVISQETPVLSNLAASDITYGQQFQQSVLSGDSTVGGSFAFVSPTSVPDAGTADYDVIFTPTDSVNYSSVTGSVSVTVDQRLLTTTGVSADNKVYDGTAAATLSGGTLNNTVGGDDVSLSNLVGTFSQVDVGTGLAVTPSLTLTGDDVANYVLQQPTGLSANITAKELTVSGATAEDKAYDGTDVATISGASLSGVVGGDSVTLVDGTTGTFSQSDVGTDIAVTTAMSIGGTDASNYTLAGQPSGLTADITAASQTISNFLPADGTNLVATTTNVLSATASSGSNVTFAVVAGSATITDGTNLSFSASGTVEVEASQAGGGNYAAAIPVTNTYTVVKADADVTLSDLAYTYDPDTGRAATAATDPVGLTVNLTYDGGATLPTNVGTYEVIAVIDDVLYQGAVTNDLVISKASADVTLGSLAQTYDGNPHAATATTDPVDLTVDLTYDGSATAPTAAGTYEVIGVVNDANYQGSATNNLVISKATPVLSDLSATDITYSEQLVQSTLSGSSGGVAGSLAFVSPTEKPDAGTADHDVVFTPTDLANYNDANGSVSVTVNQRQALVTGVSAQDKTYDGTTDAVLSGGTLVNIVSGDTVALDNLVGTFSQAGVGTGLSVTPALTLSGADAANYTLEQPTGLEADITAKGLTVSGATAEDKSYDGTTDAVVSGATLEGVVGEDTVTLVNGTSGIFITADVGTDIDVSTVMSLGGADAGNYTLSQPSGLNADITAGSQTISSFLPVSGAELVVTTTNALSASASSGQDVTFSVVSGPGTISGGTALSFSGVGTVLVEAVQAGGGNYAAATPVTNTYTVIHGTPTVGTTDIPCPSGKSTKFLDSEILANCSDPEGSAMTVSLVGNISTNGGTVSMIGSWILFTPKEGSDADDAFQVAVTNAYGNGTTGWVTVAIETTPATVSSQSALGLTSAGGNNTLSFLGIPGYSYTVQIKTNLVSGSWEDLVDVQAAANGQISTVHTNAPSPCYYRMVE